MGKQWVLGKGELGGGLVEGDGVEAMIGIDCKREE